MMNVMRVHEGSERQRNTHAVIARLTVFTMVDLPFPCINNYISECALPGVQGSDSCECFLLEKPERG